VSIIVDLENKLYTEELGAPLDLNFKRNDDTLDLIFAKKKSLYAQLENTTMLAGRSTDPNATFDEDFCDNVKKECSKHARIDFKDKVLKKYMKAKPDCPGAFIVDHYAAHVIYNADGFIDKNQDKVTDDMVDCLAECALMNPVDTKLGGKSFMSEIWERKQTEKGGKNPSVFGAFKSDLFSLVATLSECSTGFVRCIKPNTSKQANIYESDLVLTQLAYTGMLSTLKITKMGYPARLKHQDYLDIYRCLAPDAAAQGLEELVKYLNDNIMPGVIEAMVEKPPEEQLTSPAVRVGKMKYVLMRDWARTALDVKAREIKGQSAVIIQCQYRACDSLQFYQSRVKACEVLMPGFRGLMARLEYYPKKYARLEMTSRTTLVHNARAAMAKKTYYAKRIEFFETINRHTIQNHLYAYIQRQLYYEIKLKFQEKERAEHERDRFGLYEGHAREQTTLMAQMRAEEAGEIGEMVEEDLYVEALIDATIKDQFHRMKGEEIEIADKYMELGRKVVARVAAGHAAIGEVGELLASSPGLLHAHDLMIHEVMGAEGMTLEITQRVVAEPLRPLPHDMSDINALREYRYGLMCPSFELPHEEDSLTMTDFMDEEERMDYKAQKKEEAEAKADELRARKRRERAERGLPEHEEEAAPTASAAVGASQMQGLELTANTDLRSMSQGAKEEFLANIAHKLGVDPSRVKLRL